jgi:SAM-dependent methyltransferase
MTSSRKQLDFYATHYGAPATFNNRLKNIYGQTLKLRPKALLDIGCGNGILLGEFLKAGINAQGVDVSKEAVNICKGKGFCATEIEPEQPLPFSDAHFDVITCSEVIEHVFSPDFLLEEIYRILSPDGYLILTTPNLGWWVNRLDLFLGYQPNYTEVSSRYDLGKRTCASNVSGHIRVFTHRSLIELLEIYGFSVIRQFGTEEENITNHALAWFDRQLKRRLSLASNIGVVCKKNDSERH